MRAKRAAREEKTRKLEAAHVQLKRKVKALEAKCAELQAQLDTGTAAVRGDCVPAAVEDKYRQEEPQRRVQMATTARLAGGVSAAVSTTGMVLWWAGMLLCMLCTDATGFTRMAACIAGRVVVLCVWLLPRVYRNTVQEHERKHRAYVMRDALLLIGNCATFALRVVISFYIGAVLWEQKLYRV